MINKEPVQIELEETYSKYELIPFLVQRGKELIEGDLSLDQECCSLILGFLLMQKRMTPEELMGRVYVKIKDITRISICLEKLIEKSLLIYDPDRDEIITAYRLNDEDEAKRLAFMYPLPMVVEPRELKDNYDTGYLKTKYSIICRNKAGSDDYNLDHINRVNKIPLKINTDVLRNCQNQNKNPPKTEQEKKNFKKFTDAQRNIAESYVDENKFWLTHRYDKRGRIYPTGYWINYQGNDFGKAIIDFYEGEIVQK